MAIIQISKIQVRSGNLTDLPQLAEGELGWANDANLLFIGKTAPVDNIEVLTSYSDISFSQIDGAIGNLNISNNVAIGQILAFDGTDWVNRGGDVGGFINLGNIGNLTINGGSNGQFLQTNGNGNLSWSTPPVDSIISNGTSNVNIPAVNGNVNTSVGGISNVLVVTTTGANVTGTFAATGNVSGGNLTTTGVLNVTGTGISTINGNLDMANNTIINLATPTNPTDAATKQYVDDIAQGLNIHDSVAAATTGTLAVTTGGTITYNNGISGVGATLVTSGTYTTIDGVNVATVGLRILVKNEANAVHNGIYTYTNSTTITRATDYDTVTEVKVGDFVFVNGGTQLDNTGWVQTESITAIGAAGNNINFTQFSGAGTYTAGTGLTLTGSQFSVNASQTQVTAVGTLSNLSVTGNISAGNIVGIFANGNSNISIPAANGNITFATAGSERMRLNSSGSLGIGTSSPGQKLDVYNGLISVGGSVNGKVLGYSSSNTQIMDFGVSTGTGFGTDVGIYNLVLGNITFGTNSIERMRIANTGAVTINAPSSGNALTVNGNLQTTGNITTNNYLINSVQTGISASGSTQGTATVLGNTINVVSIVSSGANGVRLPTAIAGMTIYITNTTANSLNVYPDSGVSINFSSINVPLSQGANSTIHYIASSPTQWYSVGATYA